MNTRKRLAGAVLGVAAIMTAVAVVPARAAVPVSAWTQDGHGPGNTAYNPYESALNLGTVGDLRLRWTATPRPGLEGCETTPEPPLVAGGRVIMFENGGVGAREVRTGRRLWLETGFSYLGKTLAVVDGLVIATETSCHSQSDYEGTITALDLGTGRPVWRSRQSGTVDKLVAGSGVLVTHGFCHVCDEDRNQVVAYRVSDGGRLWTRNSADLAGEVVASARVLLASTNGTFGTQAVSLRSGAVGWRSGRAWSALSSTPAGDRFLARGDAGFSAVDSRTGKVVWSVRSTVESLSCDGRRVFAAGPGLAAYGVADGRRLWRRALAEPGRPVRAGGLLYATGGRALAIVSPVSGGTAAPGRRFGAAVDHVVVAGGRLFTTDGRSIRAFAA
ncbi:PQQ-binding-like beta-propeller repeat protein [Actinoplanes sp. NPDC049118]|uniref:outer membrane protein assembly factor BamB family protein n=1 Tax=Actinoplanes sp. NPDC049118 TaxID=3155769 RepID=UPI0033EB3690